MDPITYLLPSASTFSADLDHLIIKIAVLVGFWFFAAEGMFFWLLWRFRARDDQKAQHVTGDEPHLKRWINWPHFLVLLCDIVIVIGAVQVWWTVKLHLPDADSTVKVISQQWAWTFVHPGPDNKLDTADDITVVDELHVEVHKTYHFQLSSRDVLHSFSVPVFRLKQDAIPGRTIVGWFNATKTGEYDIQCAEICGIGHALMPARIFIESAEDHVAWMAQHASGLASLQVK